jgi:Xaa-Pro aminopeptidase
MTTVFDARLAALRAKMKTSKTDLVVVGPSSHMGWLSGVHPHGDERPVMLLVSADYAGFLMPALNANSARQNTDLPFHEWSDAVGPAAALDAIIAANAADKSGVSVVLDETMRADFALLVLDVLPNAVRRFTGDTISALRSIKDPAEYEALKASARINDAAIFAAFDALRPGMTELDVQKIILDHYKAHNATPVFSNIAFGGNGAFPHHHTGETMLTDGVAVQIDAGCRFMGYPSDMTRCGWFGTPNARYKQVFEVVEQAVQAALTIARPGIKACDVDEAARRVISDAGYGAHFPHRTGHGLGIDIHETPYIAANNDQLLVEGNVFSIEPGIYIDGAFGIRLEDIVILRADGPEILSATSRDMIIRST